MSTSDRLEELRQRFRGRALIHAVELEQALRAGDKARLLEIAHRLSGSGGTFGYPAISRIAETVERAAESMAPAPELARVLQSLLDAIRQMP